MRRCGAWPSTSYGVEPRNEIIGRRGTQVCGLGNFGRLCQCTGAMAVACPLPNLALKISSNRSRQFFSFRKRVGGEIGMKQSNGRSWTTYFVMAGQRDGAETGVAGRGRGDGVTEDLQEDLIVSSLVTEAPQVQNLHRYLKYQGATACCFFCRI